MRTDNLEDYRQFCSPSELHKAINTLRGMLVGISCDSAVSDAELQELSNWVILHENLRGKHPFTELIPAVEGVVMNDAVSEEDKDDILWLCNNFDEEGSFYDMVTSAIQVLQGLVHGVLADGELTDVEIRTLQNWIDENDYLQGVYPYDELNTLLCTALSDGRIDQSEREMLKAFLGTLIEFKDSRNLAEADFAKLREKYSIQGICAVCPEIEFSGKVFCFTGESYKGTRKEIVEVIVKLGGIVRGGVSKNTDYLIVGNAGNPCWAYSCYGRKIEEAINLRKKGVRVVIVNETDFWDAVEDA